MVRTKTKWKFVLLMNIILFSVFTKSLPVERNLKSLTVVNSAFSDTGFSELPVIDLSDHKDSISSETTINTSINLNADEEIVVDANSTYFNNTRSLFRNVRPGQTVTSYAIEITFNGGRSFTGRALIVLTLTEETKDKELVFHCDDDLTIQSVQAGIFTIVNAIDAEFDHDDGLLEIEPEQDASNFILRIEYTGSLDAVGGLYQGNFNEMNYIAMNLHAINARRVFPCMDEFINPSIVRFTFHNLDQYNNIVMNSGLMENTAYTFQPLQHPTSLWGMVAHNFNNINNPAPNVQLFARPGVVNQENQASVAINDYFYQLEDWTTRTYMEINADQDGRMLVIALPDVHKDWYALSTICIWEPYILMDRLHSVKQRKEALTEIAEAMTRQWFGFVVHPENWIFHWVVTGLSGYAAYDLNRNFQSVPANNDITLLDFNTIFISDVIQEALYWDAYETAQPLQPGEPLLEENEIRFHIYGLKLLKYKAPAIMNMLTLVLSDETEDLVKTAAQLLLEARSQDTVSTSFFVDALASNFPPGGNGRVENILEFIEPWILNNGYPNIYVTFRPGGVLVTQESFGFSSKPQVDYPIPITWTSSINPNFDTSNIRPEHVIGGSHTIDVALGDDDFVLLNIQGQGYYRTNYDANLWERIIAALEDPEQRERIHPLNRATLVDDSLNLARAGKVNYEIAFSVVLSMEHEIDYPVWKAFVRNMNFLKKRLIAYYVDDDDDRDPDIYLRMVRRTVGRVENELGFYPEIQGTEDAMQALTRGLVMDHACRAGYRPCIAAAIDWFYDPNDITAVNPNIPHEIRPAVFCTMVREGDNQVINALLARLEVEQVMYERVVIIESLACSEDSGYINTLLLETLAGNSPWSLEERNRIFAAVAESSYANARNALNFMTARTSDIRDAYGGVEKFEELIWILAENMADGDLSVDFTTWTTSTESNLGNSEMTALRARDLVQENLRWNNIYIEQVYEWIDDNDAPTLVASLLLIFASCFVALNNR